MSTIVTRAAKGSPLTHAEVDANFTNLNTDKYQSGDSVTFTTLTANSTSEFGRSSANYWQAVGAATTLTPQFVTLGSDTNIPVTFRSKGTGAVNLAPGSRGVNISNGGTVTAITRTNAGSGYTSAPDVTISPPTTAGGVQATATVAISGGSITTFTITNAGSGYVEQPTVTFSGGGGSGAAAYATVGSGTTVRSLGSTISFSTPAGEAVRISDAGVSTTNFILAGTGAVPYITSQGTNAAFAVSSNGTGNLWLRTNGAGVNQMAIAHTASAVNYVQVTGAATGSDPRISAQGSDANIQLTLQSKGTSAISLVDGGSSTGLRVLRAVASGDTFLDVRRDIGFVDLIAASGVTNGDIRLTPKGTGLVRFGTRTATSDVAITGYLEIKDSGGTTRKLAIID